MSRRVGALLVVVAAVAALVIAEVVTSGGGSGAGPDADRAAAAPLPTAVLVPPRVTLASLRGEPTVVNFWASWCDPCRKEAPELRTLARDVHGRAHLVGVNWNDPDVGRARDFVAEYGWRFPNVRDPDGTETERYALGGLPTTFILDRRGRIAYKLTGPQTAAGIERRLRGLG